MLSEGLSRQVLLVIALSLGVLHCLVHGHAEVSELSQELAARVVFRGRRLKVLDANHLLQCPRQGLQHANEVAPRLDEDSHRVATTHHFHAHMDCDGALNDAVLVAATVALAHQRALILLADLVEPVGDQLLVGCSRVRLCDVEDPMVRTSRLE